jgi:hypothetical protein
MNIPWQDLPSEIGDLELLIITSATSDNGIAFRRPLGGVGTEVAPAVEGAEKSLKDR